MKINKYFKTGLVIIFLAVYICQIIFTYINIPFLIDSDMASEMILSEDKVIMTNKWFYSTEIRFINTPLVYAFFFNFISNWRFVRTLSNAVFFLIYALSGVYLCRKLKLKKSAWLLPVLLLLPLSSDYYLIVLMGCYYIPHIVAEFLSIGLLLAASEESGKKKNIEIILLFLISFCSCIEGMRLLVSFYFPLFICTLLLFVRKFYKENSFSEEIKLLVPSTAGMLGAVAGFIVNKKFLSEHFFFKQDFKINFINFDIDRFCKVINGFFTTFGYKTGKVSLYVLLSCGIAFVIVIMLVYSLVCGIKHIDRKEEKEYSFLSLFFLCSIIVFALIYSFTDMGYTNRYNHLISVFAFPVILLGVKYTDLDKLKKYTGKTAVIIFSGGIILSGFLQMQNIRCMDRVRQTMRDAAAFVSNEGYKYGYATFWDSNVLTELTDGMVEMYTWPTVNSESDMSKIQSPDDMFEWLQKTEHREKKPEGKVFYMFRKKYLKSCKWYDSLNEDDIIYSNDEYVIYSY